MKKIKAVTLVEILISMALILVVTNFIFFRHSKSKEQLDIMNAKNKIIETFNYYSLHSLNTNSKHILKITPNTNKINIYDTDNKLIEEISLPSKLYYYFTHDQAQNDSFQINFTKNGNISKSFSVYIFNYRKKPRYKISFYGFLDTKFLKINIYKNKNDSNISYSNIYEYHKKTNLNRELFLKDWLEE